MKQQVVFYSNKRCNPAKLANTLYKIASNHSEVKIEISEEDFLQKFRVGCLDDKFKNQFDSSFKDMQDTTDAYIQCVINLPDNEEKEAIIQ